MCLPSKPWLKVQFKSNVKVLLSLLLPPCRETRPNTNTPLLCLRGVSTIAEDLIARRVEVRVWTVESQVTKYGMFRLPSHLNRGKISTSLTLGLRLIKYSILVSEISV